MPRIYLSYNFVIRIELKNMKLLDCKSLLTSINILSMLAMSEDAGEVIFGQSSFISIGYEAEI